MIGAREGHDRHTLELPAGMTRLVREVAAANPRTVLVVMSSYPCLVPDEAPAAGWTYQYATAPARFPFGHGLTYTTFGYGELTVALDGDTVTATLGVTNADGRAGSEVVQLYASYPGADQPRRRLIGFTRVALEPGEATTATIGVPVSRLELWDVAILRRRGDRRGPVTGRLGALRPDRPVAARGAGLPGRRRPPAGGRIAVWRAEPSAGGSPVTSVAVPSTGGRYSWQRVTAPAPVPGSAAAGYLALHGPVRLDWFQL
jgi:hypothetical protein